MKLRREDQGVLISQGLSMSPFSSHLGKEHSSFFLITTLSRGPNSHYSVKTRTFPREQGEGRVRTIHRAGKDTTENFLVELESELVFPTLWGGGRGGHYLKGTVLFKDEKVLGLCCPVMEV